LDAPTTAVDAGHTGAVEHRICVRKAEQHEAVAWLTRCSHEARREGGHLEWHTVIHRPGALPGMHGDGWNP
ncbi:MAG: hypothetical protein ACKPKO_08355, partial [Candidatus Fonsibacter sp.]